MKKEALTGKNMTVFLERSKKLKQFYQARKAVAHISDLRDLPASCQIILSLVYYSMLSLIALNYSRRITSQNIALLLRNSGTVKG